MEFDRLGKHCSEPSCKLLDFLPFECTSCKKTFCLEHRSFTAHKCTAQDVYAPECPMCGQVIPVTKDEDPNRKVDQHIQQGCPKESSTNHKAHTYKCSAPKCSKIEVMPVACASCRKNFCLKHRMPLDHACEVEERKRLRQESMKKTSSSTAGGPGKYAEAMQKAAAKLNPTAMKVQFMRLKMHSQGDDRVPPERRFYLEVVYAVESGVAPKMMFFDSNNSIGKVLDLIADAGRIENNNNKANSKKLHVILLKTGTPLPNDVPLSASRDLVSGDSVLLADLDALVG